MFRELMLRYHTELDQTMRRILELLPQDVPGFGVMLRYPLGWVDEHDQPYAQPTGKRFRPLLLLLCTEAAGGDWHTALPAAAAVEFLHNFSLIHDDIEDNSLTRHGRPTVWQIWGMANAINAGDALFCLAYCALEQLLDSGAPADVVMAALRVMNATTLELTRGQHLDMRFEHQDKVTVDEYISMISGKSAALVAACAQLGALVATGDESLAQRYAQFGRNLGIAFQIRDDILGIWGDPRVTGKSAATDILSRKKSLPVLYGLAQSEALSALYQREAFGEEDVGGAVSLLEALDAYDFAHQRETAYYEDAIQALEAAQPQGEASSQLKQFIETLFRRDY